MELYIIVNAILLFAFSIPVIMQYRILPIEGTPYWLFGVIFLLLISQISISLGVSKKIGKYAHKAALIVTLLVIGIVVGGVTITAITDRHRIAPVWGTHDIILQQEAAMRYLIQKKNPYKETYFGTPVESFHYDELGKPAMNPALYHFVMPPWYLVFPFALYTPSNKLIGYFDGRIVLLFCLAGILAIIYSSIKNKNLALCAMTFVALNPATIDYFIEGRSDIFALFWLMLSLFLWGKRTYLLSSIVFGLAIMSKQTIWFAVPLYIALIYRDKKTLKDTLWFGGVFIVISLLLMLPFLLWDAKAFIDSVILYLSGGSVTGYPISGYGLSMVLYSLGVISNTHAYYPFIIWQAVLGLPVLCFGIRYFLHSPTLWRFYIVYALILTVIWYTSRYFNNSHIAFISTLFALGSFYALDTEKITFKT